LEIQNAPQTQGNIKNIFIRGPDALTNFEGECWPGKSVWIDYLNTNAQEFWGSLYLRSNFLGSNYLYGTWNDMDEPSVFNPNIPNSNTMPMNNNHIQADGTIV
jgi:alpha-glucosidase (family GH31 glycosyl hydrolase)